MIEIDFECRDGSIAEFLTREKNKAIHAYRSNEDFKNKFEKEIENEPEQFNNGAQIK